MKKRLALALAAAEQAEVDSLGAATARAMGLASVTVEDSDVRLLEAELTEAKEKLNQQKEIATEEVTCLEVCRVLFVTQLHLPCCSSAN